MSRSIKLYYQNNNTASTDQKYQMIKRVRKSPISITYAGDVISRFEMHGTLRVFPGRGRVRVSLEVETIPTAIGDPTAVGRRGMSRQLDMPYHTNTVWKTFRRVLKFFP
ncbi:hypothetical protein AVEN_91050-1 [Araneus ventricosus]|uniref:DUF4817 domain-containing protein n=1 Tax=Araneus ventricosus TaxID=182803 RepID=A0A4Y2Q9H1_ARAVE|nr:hypothetical protein AVEN_91050-1 [Araneus ventricosus]